MTMTNINIINPLRDAINELRAAHIARIKARIEESLIDWTDPAICRIADIYVATAEAVGYDLDTDDHSHPADIEWPMDLCGALVELANWIADDPADDPTDTPNTDTDTDTPNTDNKGDIHMKKIFYAMINNNQMGEIMEALYGYEWDDVAAYIENALDSDMLEHITLKPGSWGIPGNIFQSFGGMNPEQITVLLWDGQPREVWWMAADGTDD